MNPFSLGGSLVPASPPSGAEQENARQWIAVRERFTAFHRNLALTPTQRTDGIGKALAVLRCLDFHYYGAHGELPNGFLAGSWGKETGIRPPRDVDVYFALPSDVHERFRMNIGNRQSALLQEVKRVLASTYSNTDMRGDGQVVVVNFDSIRVEVVPAFQLQSGRYLICDTHDGGSYQETDPWAEIDAIDATDAANNRNLRPLIMMLKAWQEWCSVPLASFELELIATDFLVQSPWRQNDFFYFDWLLRDFFAYLYACADKFVFIPGTWKAIPLGSDWKSRALTAYDRAMKACDYERYNLVLMAGDEWQNIFGPDIPRLV